MIALVIIGTIFFFRIQQTNEMGVGVHPVSGSWKTVVEKKVFKSSEYFTCKKELHVA
jgi:hypothetical protein